MSQERIPEVERENLLKKLSWELENEFLSREIYKFPLEGAAKYCYNMLVLFISYRMYIHYFNQEEHYLRIVKSFYETASDKGLNPAYDTARTNLLLNFDSEFPIESIRSDKKPNSSDTENKNYIPQLGWKGTEQGFLVFYTFCSSNGFIDLPNGQKMPIKRFINYFFGPVQETERCYWSKSRIEVYSMFQHLSDYFSRTDCGSIMAISMDERGFYQDKLLEKTIFSKAKDKASFSYQKLKNSIGPAGTVSL